VRLGITRTTATVDGGGGGGAADDGPGDGHRRAATGGAADASVTIVDAHRIVTATAVGFFSFLAAKRGRVSKTNSPAIREKKFKKKKPIKGPAAKLSTFF